MNNFGFILAVKYGIALILSDNEQRNFEFDFTYVGLRCTASSHGGKHCQRGRTADSRLHTVADADLKSESAD